MLARTSFHTDVIRRSCPAQIACLPQRDGVRIYGAVLVVRACEFEFVITPGRRVPRLVRASTHPDELLG